MSTKRGKQSKKTDFKDKELFPEKVALAKKILKDIVLPNGIKAVFD